MADETALNRAMTRLFILSDPSDISLLRPVVSKSPSGATRTNGTVTIDPQRMKLVYQGGPDDGIYRTNDGQLHKFDFVLVAEYDADVKEGDVFYYPIDSTQRWEVRGLQPYNGYEVKAGVVSYGRTPAGG